MPEAYNTLTVQEKQEVDNFVSYLIYKRMPKKQKKTPEELRAILDEYTGCMGGLWKDDDPLAYQRRLREDREIA